MRYHHGGRRLQRQSSPNLLQGLNGTLQHGAPPMADSASRGSQMAHKWLCPFLSKHLRATAQRSQARPPPSESVVGCAIGPHALRYALAMRGASILHQLPDDERSHLQLLPEDIDKLPRTQLHDRVTTERLQPPTIPGRASQISFSVSWSSVACQASLRALWPDRDLRQRVSTQTPYQAAHSK